MGDEQPGQWDALTELVKSEVGRGRRWSTRDFAALAVDPATGWSPSKSLLGKIIAGDGYRVEPRLVSAIAVGLRLPRHLVAVAAHWQVIGYEKEELIAGPPVTLLRHLHGTASSPAPLAKAVAEGWQREEEPRRLEQ